MKKVLFFALAAGVALAACTKNEVKPVEVDQEITYQAVVNKASTKALIDDALYPKTVTFGTVAYREPASGSSTGTEYIPLSEVSFKTTYWSTEKAYYWPVQGSLSFMSYSPFKYQETSGTTSGTNINVTHEYNKLKIASYDVASHQETDLMVAEIQKGQKANSTQSGTWQKGVPTIFHHKLSRVVAINFQTVNTEKPSEVKDYANGNDGSESHKYQSGDQQYFINDRNNETYIDSSGVVHYDKDTDKEMSTMQDEINGLQYDVKQIQGPDDPLRASTGDKHAELLKKLEILRPKITDDDYRTMYETLYAINQQRDLNSGFNAK